jgi:Transcriptional regulators
MDEIDKNILTLLKENSKLSNKEIGEKIFLTGQAVGNRITNMINSGIIEKFTISISDSYQETQFIRIFLNDSYFEKIEKLINQFEDIQDFYKVRGQACYVVVSHFSNDSLNHFIESLSKYARYSVESVISNKKRPLY